MRKVIAMMIVLCSALAALPALAQQTTGIVAGGSSTRRARQFPGVTVTARNAQTGFTRVDVADTEGVYRLTALPVGTYDVTAELQGFAKVDAQGHRGQRRPDTRCRVDDDGRGSARRGVTVTGGTPLIETRSSSIGGVVDIARIENLPLNGRQFANLAATVPGVGLGYHSDPTKSTQFSPQIAGGNGRNVNYLVDGGDNNDDTVGGLLQLFPLEAIQEFNFITQRYKAEYGRSNGGVMNIVTKSGTNSNAGSAFALFRDKSLNAQTHSEQAATGRRRTTALPVRRLVRRPLRAGPGVLFRRRRADAAGHEPGGRTRWGCSRIVTASIRRRFART